ncbi:hypothetical protein LTR36_000571 [Oleoguttula mirabilis]|uniref:MIF4G domain-containing protein n=1 Tax=Oleoguttula mirabilis TaxID=1507867 RepID=A0AAV9JQH8_9PEZI|nr:hypothetical protein LTR36_000571 [Oleoguttula mirabilis]
MTSAISHNAQNPLSATHASHAASGTTSPLAGAVPAQLPVRSYANATKTASPAPPTPAGASAQNAKSTDTPVNGANATAHGGSQPNGASAHADHAKKPSVVINASGASGQIPNGGPVGQNGRPPINFGSMGASGSPVPQPSAPYQSQTSSLPAPRADPRVISPAHSPSPIPQPQASGGRPPAGLQNQGNGMTFGSMGGEHDSVGLMRDFARSTAEFLANAEPQMRQSQMPLGPGMPSMHERRQSSQSMHSDIGQPNMQNMNRGFAPQGGRGRGYPQQQFGTMPSPGPNYRPLQGQAPRATMAPQFQPQPNSPYAAGRSSPAVRPAQPYQHQQHAQMPYGYPQHMNQQQVYPPFPSASLSALRPASASTRSYCSSSSDKRDSLLQPDTEAAPAESAPQPPTSDLTNEHPLTTDTTQMYPGFEPYSGHYQPYYGYGQYPGQPPQSPRPPYPSPYAAPQSQMQAPFQPPDMSRSASQSSQRPPSSLGQPQTPSLSQQAPHSQTPVPNQQTQPTTSSAFVKPKRGGSAIKITDPNGNAINFSKPSASPSTQAQPQTPVIVSTPNAPTPPPRVPSTQQTRADSQPANTKSAEETKTAFQEQVKRQVEEQKRKEQEDRDVKAKAEKDAVDAKTKLEKDAADAKTKSDKDEADANAKAEKEEADAKVKAEKEEADAKAKAEQDKADAKAKAEKAEADAKVKAQKDEADAKAKAEQEDAAIKAKEREAAEAAAQKESAAADKAAAEDKEAKEAAEAAEKSTPEVDAGKDVKEETDDERFEREVAEMEAREREEEERERAYAEKSKREKDARAKVQAEKDANADEELKRQEREAEEREEARERERNGEVQKSEEPDDEAKALFASLKKPEIGPGASAEASTEESSSATDAMPPPQPTQARPLGAQKPKPAHLKLETNKRVEPAEPTPGMQALKSARFLEVTEDAKYPDGFKSPNPALNQAGARKGRAYDKDFLLQFQNVFNEKPSVDWDQKVKETLGPGDEPGSARGPQSAARTPSGMSRQASGRPGAQAAPSFQGVMGQFGGQQRTLPPGTTSQERFAAAQMPGRPSGPAMPAQMARMPSNLGMGAGMGMNRTNSLQTTQGMQGPGSPRQQSSRGGRGGPAGGSKRGDRNMSRREEADMANKMPLTAHMDLAPLQKSTTGWKPTSIGAPSISAGPDLSGMMAPDLVQRKVKAALNKMTPEKFDKISDQILDIAAQSKHESDGRTLRQVIQLTFEKACDEAHWAAMYAKFCHRMLTAMSNEIRDETIKDKAGQPVVGGALFRKYLLNRCQEEFERGWQANLPDKPEGETEEVKLLSEEYYVAAAAKRRGLGLIQFIGQLYKLRMLTIRIMHECVLRLLNFEGAPDESAVENLTTLLRSVGGTMDEEEQGRHLMATYFQRIDEVVLKSEALPSRSKFMIMDLVDLRRLGWKEKGGASKGPKTLDEIHQDAAAAQAKQEMERARTSQRGGGGGGRMGAGRGDARNFSGNMPPPVDYNRTTVGMDDLRRLQNRGASGRATGGGLGPGGNLGPGSALGGRSGSKRGLGPPSSGNTTRTNTPPVDKDKKDEPSTQQNAFR